MPDVLSQDGQLQRLVLGEQDDKDQALGVQCACDHPVPKTVPGYARHVGYLEYRVISGGPDVGERLHPAERIWSETHVRKAHRQQEPSNKVMALLRKEPFACYR